MSEPRVRYGIPGSTAKSEAEVRFPLMVAALKLPDPEREYRFAQPERQWRFDFAWPGRMLAVEIEGGSWAGGRHTTGSGFAADLEKYNDAAIRGWRVIRLTPQHVPGAKRDDPERIAAGFEWIERAYEAAAP